MANADRRSFGIFDSDQRLSATVSPTALSCWQGERLLVHAGGGVELTPRGHAWDLAFANADARLQVRFTPSDEPYAWTLEQTPGFEHREQAGTFAGTLEVRGQRFCLNGEGYYASETGDKLTSVAEHQFTARAFIDTQTWAYATIVTVARRDYLFGCLCRSGSEELRSAEFAVAHAYAGGPALAGTADLHDVAGRRLTQTFARGAASSAVDAAPTGSIARHIALPALAGDDGPGVGQIDYWYTDPGLVRPHLFALNVAEMLA